MTIPLPQPGPSSPYFEVRATPHSGRSIFALQPISANTLLHDASDLAYYVVFREYRREVCQYCFHYEHGEILSERDAGSGVVWCNVECRERWIEEVGANGVAAFTALEGQLRKWKPKKGEEDVNFGGAGIPKSASPKEDEIASAWATAFNLGKQIISARTSPTPTKSDRKALNKVLSTKINAMILNHALSGVICSALHPEIWSTVLSLHSASQPYPAPEHLQTHLTAYQQLLALCPPSLFPYITPETLLTTINRDAHNSFGIRSLDDDASEMFGYGTWPSASYWNHSCEPNVRKERRGRSWVFTAERDIDVGEELCITYLGGEEKVQGVEGRRKGLEKAWGFVCGCTKCVREAERVKESATCIDQQTDSDPASA